MVNLRCTDKLRKRLKLPPLGQLPPSEGLFDDWHASLAWVDRRPLVIAVEDRTLLPLVIRARDLDRLPVHLSQALRDLLRSLGVERDTAERYAEGMTKIRFGKTSDRSVLGMVREFTFLMKHFQDRDDQGLANLAEQLADVPCGPIGYESPERMVLRAIRFRDGEGAITSSVDPRIFATSRRQSARELRVKIVILGTEPPIWRRLSVPEGLTLEQFHLAIQGVFGWENCHLYDFQYAGRSYTSDTERPREAADAAGVRLSELDLEAGDEVLYTYDFGDDWAHSIVVEGSEDADPAVMHPRCMGGERACPPEDCGGVHMYGQLLHELTLPPRRRDRELLEWLPPDFDPERFDVDRANERLRSIRARR